MHVRERHQAIVQCRRTEKHVAVRVPAVKAHARGFVLCRTFCKPKRLQGKRNHRENVSSCPFVVVVRIAELNAVKVRECLASAFDAHEVAEFVGNHVRNPAVAAADFKIPVGQPKVDCIFAWNCATVAVKGVVQDGAHASRKCLVVSARDGIVNGFGVCRNFCRMRGIFHGVNKLEMIRSRRFPLDIALVTIKTGC